MLNTEFVRLKPEELQKQVRKMIKGKYEGITKIIIKGMWSISNRIIRSKSPLNCYPDYIIKKDDVICSRTKMARVFSL